MNLALHLTAIPPSVSDFGSTNVSDLIKQLDVKFTHVNAAVCSNDYAERKIKCIIASRLFLLAAFKAHPVVNSPIDWLFFQLFPPKLNEVDIFAILSKKFAEFPLVELVKYIESHLPDNLLVFLDEGQHLAQALSNKFVSSRFGNPPRPLYNIFIHAVTVFSELKLTIMGISRLRRSINSVVVMMLNPLIPENITLLKIGLQMCLKLNPILIPSLIGIP